MAYYYILIRLGAPTSPSFPLTGAYRFPAIKYIMQGYQQDQENMEFVQTAIRNMSEKLDSLSRDKETLSSNLLAATSMSQNETESLKKELANTQQRIHKYDEKIESLAKNNSEVDENLEKKIQRIHELFESSDRRMSDLVELLASSHTLLENTKQEASSNLTDISEKLQLQVNSLREKTAQYETDLKSVNVTVQDLSDMLAFDVETDQLTDELASISNNSTTGVSTEEIKRIKDEVRGLKTEMAKMNQLRDLQAEINSLKSSVNEQADKFNTLHRNVTKMDDELSGQNRQYTETSQQIERLSETVLMQSSQIDTLAGVVQKLIEKKKNKGVAS